MTNNDYYVYEHIRDDTGKCFYVGKGHGKRAYQKSRNEHHDRVTNKTSFTIKIIKDNLTEEEAYKLEREVIEDYVFNKKYGIDIIGYNNNKDENGHLTNHSFGGDGSYGMVHSEEWKHQHSKDMVGEKNPMYGINVWDSYTEEEKQNIKEKIRKSSSGSNNPMYNISPSERMSEEKYKEWKEKTVNRLKAQTGSNNPNWHNDTLKKKLEANPELKKQYYSRVWSQNGRAVSVNVFDENKQLIKTFGCLKDCAIWINEICSLPVKLNTIISNIKKRCKNRTQYCGYYFEYV